MTVAELIAKLSEYPPELPVALNGGDPCGTQYDNVTEVERVELPPSRPPGHGWHSRYINAPKEPVILIA